MKRCQYCGKEYTDKVAVCPVDGQPLIDPEAIPKPAPDRPVFKATLSSSIFFSGQYRIYVRGGDLIFILIEDSAHSILNSIHGLLGPLGIIVPLFLWLFSRRKTRDWKQRLETAEPEDLILEDTKNFRLHFSEIREASLEPPSLWRLKGASAGCLKLLIRQGDRMKLELSEPADMAIVRQLLASRLPGIFRMNVEWNATAGRFQKKTTPASI